MLPSKMLFQILLQSQGRCQGCVYDIVGMLRVPSLHCCRWRSCEEGPGV